jgi:hypothetical protein
MATFIVQWENEVNAAKNPLEAAADCLYELRAGNQLGFTVTNCTTKKKYFVDLQENTCEEINSI